MTKERNLSISIVGSGNVATHMARAIAQSGHLLHQVLSRNIQKAERLAKPHNAKAIDSMDALDEVDIIILAIKDEALHKEYISQFPENSIICHTSGSVAMDVLKQYPNHGIFYPLQTFSKQKEVDFKTVPICLEASSDSVLHVLQQLAESISTKVHIVNSEQRQALHLAAVFACNFTNLMYDLSEELVQKSGLDFEILRPLISETAAKVQEHLPSEVQTGPAVRSDQKIITKHLQLLNQHSEIQNIYKILTDEISLRNEKL